MQAVEGMVERGIELDVSDYDGRTPLHLAASEGHSDLVSYIIKQGVKNINPIDRWGSTPYDDAMRGEYLFT